MKIRHIIFLLFICVCSAKAQTSEIVAVDTINKIDIKGYKVGKWVIKGKHKPGSGYAIEQTIETGMYMNNRKEGVWIEFYKNGKMRTKLTYVNGTLNARALFYDETEKVRSQGAFKDNKWLGGQ